MSPRTRLSVTLTLLALAGCGRRGPLDNGVVCTDDFRFGITVTVTDSVTGLPPGSATLYVTGDKSFADTVGPGKGAYLLTPNPPTLRLSTAGERAGTYNLTVKAAGYNDWTRNNVSVSKDQCHVIGVAIAAKLVEP